MEPSTMVENHHHLSLGKNFPDSAAKPCHLRAPTTAAVIVHHTIQTLELFDLSAITCANLIFNHTKHILAKGFHSFLYTYKSSA
jgi:hypothetical protein